MRVLEPTEKLGLLAFHHLQLLRNGLGNDLRNDLRIRHGALAVRGGFFLVSGTRLEGFLAFRLRCVDKQFTPRTDRSDRSRSRSSES